MMAFIFILNLIIKIPCSHHATYPASFYLQIKAFIEIPEDPGYKEAGQPWDVSHQLHHEEGEHLVLGVHLARTHWVTVPG